MEGIAGIAGIAAKQACPCGVMHREVRSTVQVGPGILDDVASLVQRLPVGSSCLLVCDQNTYEAAGKWVVLQLEQAGKRVQMLQYVRKGPLTADAYALGELAFELSAKPDFLVGVGSGTISDLVRYTAHIVGVPFILIATAPSMDGYASTVAPLVQKGSKRTFLAKEPLAIVGDTDVLANAPPYMIVAGVGDLLGKFIAKADWKLGHRITGEPYCPVIQEQVDQALDLCLGEMKRCCLADRRFVQVVMEGLILSGQAITMFGNSRPASGADHHLAHFWEMKALEQGRTIGLHGQKVGLGTRIMLQLYAEVAQRVQDSDRADLRDLFASLMSDLPSVSEYDALLKTASIDFAPSTLGITADWIEEGLLKAMYVRDRYTILRFASSQGWLEELASTVLRDYK